MTKDHAVVSFQLHLSEIALLAEEAKQANTTRSNLCTQIMLGRQAMVVQITPQYNRVIAQQEVIIQLLEEEKVTLQAQKDALLERIIQHEFKLDEDLKQAHKALLADYETTYLKEGILRIQYDSLQEDLSRLQQEQTKTEEKLRLVQAEKLALAKQLKGYQTVDGISDLLTRKAGTFVEKSPLLQEQFKETGLKGFVFGQGRSAEAVEDQQLGHQIRQAFGTSQRLLILDVLHFLGETPGTLDALLAGAAYKAYKASPTQEPRSS